jgi:hypothetical protein
MTGFLALTACTHAPRVFAPRAAFDHDTDLQSWTAKCRKDPTKKDPNHLACTPEKYISPLVWDGLDNSVFRPLSRVFAVDPPGEARNFNSLDEVADSAWFTNRLGHLPMTATEISHGACTEKQLLASDPPDGAWLVDEGKLNGSSAGFRVNIEGKGKYLFKGDDAKAVERTTAASVIGAAVYEAAGFFTSCEQIVYFKRSALKLKPGLTVSNNTTKNRPFDEAALDKILADASKRGGLIRMQASAWLPGSLLGPFQYEGTRDDDRNDIIDHKERRELRGARVLAAWIDHFDSREQNTMDSWIADDAKNPDSSPGYVRHYYLDLSDTLGSEWDWDGISRRLGYSYLLDWGDIGLDFITLGIPRRTWDTTERTKGREKFGYFNVPDFVPDEWKNEYPNPAFGRASERDNAWMARIMAHFSPEMVQTLSKMANFTDPGDTEYLNQVLEGRLQRILDRYLTHLSPIAHVRIEAEMLCAVDLAEMRAVRTGFQYEARLGPRILPIARHSETGEVCFTLPAKSEAEAYSSVTITDGVARGPLVVWLYSDPTWFVAGLERP